MSLMPDQQFALSTIPIEDIIDEIQCRYPNGSIVAAHCDDPSLCCDYIAVADGSTANRLALLKFAEWHIHRAWAGLNPQPCDIDKDSDFDPNNPTERG